MRDLQEHPEKLDWSDHAYFHPGNARTARARIATAMFRELLREPPGVAPAGMNKPMVGPDVEKMSRRGYSEW